MSIYQRIRQSEFWTNVFRLLAGNSSAQLINVLIAPLLTRLYTPQEFGIFALYMAGLTLGATVAAGKYETAILLPEKNHYAWHIVALCFVLSLAFAGVFGLFGLTFSYFFPSWVSASLGIWIAPVIILTSGILTLNSWLTRLKKYATISRGKIVQATTTGVFAVGLGYFSKGGLINGLIISAIIGQSAAVMYLLVIVRKQLFAQAIQWRLFKSLARRYSDFPLFALSSEGVAALSRELPNYLINIFFGSATLGYFSLAMRVLNLPKIALSMTLGEVYVQRASEMQQTNSELGRFTDKLMILLLGAAVLCFVPLAWQGEWIFSLAFGEAWSTSGTLSASLAPWFILWFASSPLAYIFYVKRKLPFLLGYQIVLLFVRVWMFLAWGEQLESETFFWYYALSNAVAELILLWMIRVTAYRRKW